MCISALQITIGLLIGAFYFYMLFRCSRNKPKTFRNLLIVIASLIFITHFIADLHVMRQIYKGDPTLYSYASLIPMAFLHSIEIFAFQTYFFENGYQEFFFGTADSNANPEFAFLYIVTFIMACITSISFAIKVLGRKKAGRDWLADNKSKAGQAHVFFSGGEIASVLAKDIRKQRPNDLCIYIGYSDPDEELLGLSILEKIKLLFRTHPNKQLGPYHAIVYSHIPLYETSGEHVCRQMNLKDLDVFLKTPSCKVYLLSDNEEENLRCTELLYKDGCVAEIFCRACREGANGMYEKAMTATPSMSVHLVDSSYLAVRNILNCEELLPVQYVDKGEDSNHLLEGWVSSELNTMILGFGETGREMLGFLYEFGAFVDKNFKKSPFTCEVLDNNMGNLEQSYRKNFPGLNQSAGITFKQCEIGSNDFWDHMSTAILRLNYIVVCLGNDRVNLRVAVDLVEFAHRQGKDLSKNFVILIAQEDPTHLDEVTLKHYNSISQYHHCIKTFGNKNEVWTYDNITNESLTARAKRYFAGYLRAQDKNSDAEAEWNKRDEVITSTTDFATQRKRIRQRSQDYANCFHISTKMALVGPEIKDHCREIAESIPASYTNTHYTGTDAHVETVLHYLAVQEHIRWEASHVALGYTPGSSTDEIKKTHACILDYNQLEPKTQHYDYLVIKTTFYEQLQTQPH